MKLIKDQIKKLSKEFDLKYNPSWFKRSWISVRHEILTEYIGMSSDPIYQKYGKTAEQRIKNINKFVNSKDFKNCLKRYGGQVAKKKDLNKEEKLIEQIKDEKLKKELLEFQEKIRRQFERTDYLALLTIPRNNKEKKEQISILRHEWIHILLHENKINFQSIYKKLWTYDEGINEYLGAYLDKTLNNLEKFKDKENYPTEKKYWVYAIKFRELLKGKNTPKERKKTIIHFMHSLKKEHENKSR